MTLGKSECSFLRVEKSRKKTEDRPHAVICGSRFNRIAYNVGQLGDWMGREMDEDDPRCLFCGSFEDLRGHANSKKIRDIFLSGTSCEQLHG
jgi:hypothetical protein